MTYYSSPEETQRRIEEVVKKICTPPVRDEKEDAAFKILQVKEFERTIGIEQLHSDLAEIAIQVNAGTSLPEIFKISPNEISRERAIRAFNAKPNQQGVK